MAPGNATQDMYVNKTGLSTLGGKAVGVPGELKGLWYLHRRFLFDENREVKPAGSVIYRLKLGQTLKTIAAEGADAFYNGSLTDHIVADIQDADGIITRKDLEQYEVDVTDPMTFEMTSPPVTVYSMPPPGSGVVLEYILNILSGRRVAMDTMWFNRSLVAAVDAPRMHHQLLPPQLLLEKGFPEDIRKGLEDKGHVIMEVGGGSVVQAIQHTADDMLLSVSDYRKAGKPDGF
nr:hypothetical protein BaRGS_015052 [Batillaria attramentaria]